MRLTFKYPVYPTQQQEETLLKWLDHLCELQNSARHDRLVAYETEGAFVSLVAECKKIGFAGERGMAQLEDYRTILYYE